MAIYARKGTRVVRSFDPARSFVIPFISLRVFVLMIESYVQKVPIQPY